MGSVGAKPEVYMLYQLGLEPKDIIKLKIVSRGAAYRYWKKYNIAKANLHKILMGAKK